MRRDSVSLLIDMTRTAMDMVWSIRMAAEALEEDGDVTELMAGNLEEALTELEMMREELREYRDTKAED